MGVLGLGKVWGLCVTVFFWGGVIYLIKYHPETAAGTARAIGRGAVWVWELAAKLLSGFA